MNVKSIQIGSTVIWPQHVVGVSVTGKDSNCTEVHVTGRVSAFLSITSDTEDQAINNRIRIQRAVESALVGVDGYEHGIVPLDKGDEDNE